jgi:hypothetical protein
VKHFYVGAALVINKDDLNITDFVQICYGVEDNSIDDARNELRRMYEEQYPNSIVKFVTMNELSLEDLEKAVKDLKDI